MQTQRYKSSAAMRQTLMPATQSRGMPCPVVLQTTLFLIVAGCLVLTGCGSSSDSSNQTTEVAGEEIVSGQINGFGSVYVNGGQYETGTTQFVVDGVAMTGQAGQDALATGMVFQLRVETDNGAFADTALEVIYDDGVEGPITSIVLNGTQKVGIVFGQTVIFDELNTLFEPTIGNRGFNFATIGVGQVVEVSGFRQSATEVTAIYVGFVENLNPGVSEVELRGTISTLIGAAPNQSFVLDGVAVTTNVVTDLQVPGGVLAENLYAEVHGVIQADSSVVADTIESETEGFEADVDAISLQGLVSMFNSAADFETDGQAVDASGVSLANIFPNNAASMLADGVEIEVEGEITGGVLIANVLELREGESILKTVVRSIDLASRSFELDYPPLAGSIRIATDDQTLFEDEGPAQLPNFSLDLLNIGDTVEVEGINANGSVNALMIKRKIPGSSKLRGVVDTFVNGVSITILGITFPVDGSAEYQGGGMTSPKFFVALGVGNLVAIVDDEPDGDADEVDFE